eukprot:m.457755 g.457755  ORF g.457755 m.457755 type:complete len:205 (+) comp20335_c1_seq3:735-1349(+)
MAAATGDDEYTGEDWMPGQGLEPESELCNEFAYTTSLVNLSDCRTHAVSLSQAYTPESGPYHVARGAVGFREGTAKFVFRVIKDLEHNEGVLFGASRKVISTPDFQGPNNDMWLYRAFSGNLYDCGKEIETKLEKFTTGDRVTVEIDFDEDQIAFRKNDGPRTKVFTGIVGEELFPVVAFYYNLKSEVALESVSGDALPPKAAI